MAAPPSLTPDAILALNSGNTELRPLVQVLDIRQIGTAQAVQERYRMVLSDGTYVQQAMLATQLNELVKSGQVQKGTIVQLVEYICNTVQQRRIIIVLSMQVVMVTCEIIGDPKQIISTEQSLPTTGSGAGQQQNAPSAVPQIPPVQSALGAQPVNGLYPKAETVNNMGNGSSSANVTKPQQSSVFHAQGGVNANGSNMRPGVSAYQQPPPAMYSNRGPIVKNEAPARIVPITALNPYQGRWTIKARVTSKGELRRFHNAKGEGKVFSFDLLDAEGGEIRATCFNNVADQFYDVIETGRVYLVSKGSLKAAQKNFNHLKNDWEIFLESTSTIEACFEGDDSIPSQQFNFRPISEIENMEGNMMIDIVGVVSAISPTATIMRKNGTETQKRSLQLRDNSGRSVELTMWGGFCAREGQYLQDLCDNGQSPVLVVKAARISDFGGKSVGTISSSQLLINPDLPKAAQLKQWFELEGKNSMSQSISREAGGSGTRTDMRKSLSQIKDENLGRSEKPDWIAVKATISFIKVDNFCYTACPLPVGDRQCNKKVINNGDGTWRCDRCEKSIPECDYRYLLSLQVQDHTGVSWITAFQEAGEEIMGTSAKELYMWKQDENEKFGTLIQSLLFTQSLFKLKVKEESYNDELRVKCTVVKADRLEFSAESKILVDLIGRLSRGELNIKSTIAPTPTPSTNGGPTIYGTSYNSSNGLSQMQGAPSYSNAGAPYGGGGFNGSGSNYQSYGGGGSSMYEGGGSCYKCGRGGHLPRDCPSNNNSRPDSSFGGGGAAFGGGGATFGGGGGGGGGNPCFKCGQEGHWARDCPNQGNGGPAGKAMNNPGYGGNIYGRGF